MGCYLNQIGIKQSSIRLVKRQSRNKQIKMPTELKHTFKSIQSGKPNFRIIITIIDFWDCQSLDLQRQVLSGTDVMEVVPRHEWVGTRPSWFSDYLEILRSFGSAHIFFYRSHQNGVWTCCNSGAVIMMLYFDSGNCCYVFYQSASVLRVVVVVHCFGSFYMLG